MLSLFNRTHSQGNKTSDEKISKTFFSFIDSQTLVSTLPLVNRSFKTDLDTTYAVLKEAASERVLIYKKTLKPAQFFSTETADTFEYKRLSGGFTNCTFEVRLQSQAAYISRIPGSGSELFIDRRAEFFNARIASELGLNPQVIYNDGLKGEQLTVCLEKPQPLTPELLTSHPRFLLEIALQFKKLHNSKKPFINEADIFIRNKTLYDLITKHQLGLPQEYRLIKAWIEKLQPIFANLDIKRVPCHNDPYYNNFLLSGDRVWLIDWEYSGNHDALWDLAYYAKLAHLSEEQNQLLLSTYFDTPHFKLKHASEYRRFLAYKVVVDDFVFLWAYAQLANKNNSANSSEFTQWAEEALKSSLALIQTAEFVDAVDALEKESRQVRKVYPASS